MISNEDGYEEWLEERRVAFEEYKKNLPQVPGPDAKKEYVVLCKSKEDWDHIHEILMLDGTLEDNIPSRHVDCASHCGHSDVRGIYLLDDWEVGELKKHPSVVGVNIHHASYPGTFMDNPDDITMSTPLTKVNRYPSNVWCQGYMYGNINDYLTSSPGADLKNRGSHQMLRHMQRESPWVSGWWSNADNTDGVASTTGASVQLGNRLPQYGTGKDVDVIVCDQDMWFGHIEFQNTLGISTLTTADTPTNYVGGNALSNSGISTTVGTCDLLDLTLDAPYYLDPDFFNADPSNRLETRWDGTTVPTDAAARNWWRNNSTTYRSPKFVTLGIGTGTAVPGSDFDFGQILVNTFYSRSVCNGSNTAYQTGTGYHATPCASQAYGRQYGWAYNSNKWFLNHYGTNNSGWEVGFDQQKVFHRCKRINPAYGTKDPTISSNSWGHRLTPDSTGWISHRNASGDGKTALDGSDMVQYNSKPNCLVGYNNAQLGICYSTDNSVIQAGKELVDSGVLYFYAAGNQDQKQVNGDHPDYNNYYSNQQESVEDARRNALYSSMSGTQYYTFYNRPGYPGQIGERTGDDGSIFYKSFGVGAGDEVGTTTGIGTYYRECKTFYSNTGSAIDLWAMCDLGLSACEDNSGTRYNRYDAYYILDGVTSIESEDRLFNGTSSATPIAVGLMATKLEYNRDWTWADVRQWLGTLGSFESITDAAGTSAVYTGTEAGNNINDSNWLDSYNLQGSQAPMIWDAPTGNEPDQTKLMEGGANPISFTGNITIKITE
tara:strand:- start:1111 stop:3429 length:2319 start_codon:yes stop_codon:yes gene_type:complete